jgi:ribosome maturation factor RimP
MEIALIKQITEPILEERHLFLVDLKISKNNVIEIFIDAMEGVNIQTCMDISREIESHLNRDDEDFELTVSSAGIGYPFKVEKQYLKNLEKMVDIKFQDNRAPLQGILKSYTPECITIEYSEKRAIEGKKKKELVKVEQTFTHVEIKEIKDVVTF